MMMLLPKFYLFTYLVVSPNFYVRLFFNVLIVFVWFVSVGLFFVSFLREGNKQAEQNKHTKKTNTKTKIKDKKNMKTA